MKTLIALVERNRKLFFRDKGMFLSSMITPLILIVLYATFLARVYKDSFVSSMPEFMKVSDKIIDGTVASQLAAALLAVSCITVTFCVNLTMVQDVASGVRKDFYVSPVNKTTLYIGYFLSTVLNSILVNGLALVLCLAYVASMGWFLSGSDVILLALDMIVLILFGSVLSSVICFPLKSQGQMSAVGTIVSAGYGFICGAYMPISNFGEGLQKVLSFFPGTYGTSLIKNRMLRGVFAQMKEEGFPDEVVTSIADSLDCNPVLLGHKVSTPEMMLIMLGTIVVLGAIYLIMAVNSNRKRG